MEVFVCVLEPFAQVTVEPLSTLTVIVAEKNSRLRTFDWPPAVICTVPLVVSPFMEPVICHVPALWTINTTEPLEVPSREVLPSVQVTKAPAAILTVIVDRKYSRVRVFASPEAVIWTVPLVVSSPVVAVMV